MTANGIARFGPAGKQLELADHEPPPERYYEIEGVEYLDTDVPESGLSILDPPDTTSPKYSKWSYRGRFMEGKEKEYAATLEAYQAIYKGESNGHTLALIGCRTYASLRRESTTGDVKVFGDSCRDRWCPMCAGQKASYAKDQTELYLRSLKAPRFLTLTLRNNESDLKSQVEFLQQSFSRLRCRAFWKKKVTGGIWFLQVKRGKNSGEWHPHLHILLDGEYLEHGRLSRLWELVTFGSPIIDIQKISDIENAAKYVSRYTSRPAQLSTMSLDDRIEVIEALFRKRLCGTFGSAKTVTLTPPKVEATGDWNNIGNYDDIVTRASYCPKARAIMVAYNTYQPLDEKIFEEFTGHPPGHIDIVITPRKVNPQLYLDFYNT